MKVNESKFTDKPTWKAAYQQAIADLEQVEGLTDQQIVNNAGDIVRKMATIQKKTLKALKETVLK
jgi:hypothetical protein